MQPCCILSQGCSMDNAFRNLIHWRQQAWGTQRHIDLAQSLALHQQSTLTLTPHWPCQTMLIATSIIDYSLPNKQGGAAAPCALTCLLRLPCIRRCNTSQHKTATVSCGLQPQPQHAQAAELTPHAARQSLADTTAAALDGSEMPFWQLVEHEHAQSLHLVYPCATAPAVNGSKQHASMQLAVRPVHAD